MTQKRTLLVKIRQMMNIVFFTPMWVWANPIPNLDEAESSKFLQKWVQRPRQPYKWRKNEPFWSKFIKWWTSCFSQKNSYSMVHKSLKCVQPLLNRGADTFERYGQHHSREFTPYVKVNLLRFTTQVTSQVTWSQYLRSSKHFPHKISLKHVLRTFSWD